MNARMTTRILLIAIVAAGIGLAPRDAAAQSGSLLEACAQNATPFTDQPFCNTLAAVIEIAQPRIAVSAAGGNPTLGTSSTLGMRIASLPRIAIAPRATVSHIELPAIDARDGPGSSSFVPVVAVDASVGVFRGIRLFPTVGGFGSIDAYGSVGRVFLPSEQGFNGGATTGALGVQLGILRESFTAPGITLTGTYRMVTDITAGDADLQETAGYYALENLSGWGARGTVGKRVLLFSVTGGVGYDRYQSDVRMRFVDSLRGMTEIERNDFTTDRITAFANLGFTIVIVSLVGELGWQQGSDPLIGASDLVEKHGWYGGLALRVVL